VFEGKEGFSEDTWMLLTKLNGYYCNVLNFDYQVLQILATHIAKKGLSSNWNVSSWIRDYN